MKEDFRIKHLEFVQGVINRLANNSFLIKAWVITVFLAGIGYFFNQKQPLALLATIFVILIFWLLDTFYLEQERLYRKLYADVANGKLVRPFNMNVLKYKRRGEHTLRIMFSYPLVLLYLSTIVVILLIYRNICLN